MNKYSKFLCLILAVVLLLSALVACESADEETTTADAAVESTETETEKEATPTAVDKKDYGAVHT